MKNFANVQGLVMTSDTDRKIFTDAYNTAREKSRKLLVEIEHKRANDGYSLSNFLTKTVEFIELLDIAFLRAKAPDYDRVEVEKDETLEEFAFTFLVEQLADALPTRFRMKRAFRDANRHYRDGYIHSFHSCPLEYEARLADGGGSEPLMDCSYSLCKLVEEALISLPEYKFFSMYFKLPDRHARTIDDFLNKNKHLLNW